MLEIRDAVAPDAAALAGIFARGVQEGAAPHYSAAEREAWCPAPPDPQTFWAGLADQTILLARCGAQAVGFMSLTGAGHLHMAYVLPEARGTGVADSLLSVVENRALAAGLTGLTTRASHLARPFLARRGWQVVAPVEVLRRGVVLAATDMRRDLAADGLTSGDAGAAPQPRMVRSA